MTSEQEEISVAWVRRLDELESAHRHLLSFIQHICTKLQFETLNEGPSGFRYRFVDPGRIKKPDSIVSKMRRYGDRYTTPWELDDILGFRVVVVSQSDANRLADTIARDVESPLSEVKSQLVESGDGYRATHVVGWLPDWDPPLGCEIQIRTGLQDLWAIVSSQDIYKRDVGDDVTDKARDLAERLAEIDAEIQLVRELAGRLRGEDIEAQPFEDDTEGDSDE